MFVRGESIARARARAYVEIEESAVVSRTLCVYTRGSFPRITSFGNDPDIVREWRTRDAQTGGRLSLSLERLVGQVLRLDHRRSKPRLINRPLPPPSLSLSLPLPFPPKWPR